MKLMAASALNTAPGLVATIDRCGYLIMQEMKAKVWLDELAQLKSQLRASCEDQSADKAVRLRGSTYYVDLAPRELRREIKDKKAAFRALQRILGLATLMERVTISFKLLDSTIGKEKQPSFVVTQRSGPRDITAGTLKPTAV
jgi:hypothetical protein